MTKFPFTVRHAYSYDYNRFEELWDALTKDLYDRGAEIKPTPYVLGRYMQLFNNYIYGHLEGVAAVVDFEGELEGALLWGETPGGLEYRAGKVAFGWGTYVTEKHRDLGLSKSLRAFACQTLKAKGFTEVQMSVHRFNEAGLQSVLEFGAYPVSTNFVLPLEGK